MTQTNESPGVASATVANPDSHPMDHQQTGSVPVLVMLPPQLTVLQPDALNAAAQAVANALAQSLNLPADLASQLAVTIAPNPAAMGFFHASACTSALASVPTPAAMSASLPAIQPKTAPQLSVPVPRSAHHQRVTIDNTYESLNRTYNTFYVNMKNIRPSVTPDQVLDFFTHICPLSLVHIHLPDRPAKFPGRKAVLVFNDKYDADAFYHQLTLRVETGELDEMFALTQADMDAWARQFPQLAGDDPFGYKRVPLRLDVSRHTMPVPQPIVGPNAAPVASASGANGWVGVESWRPSARMATRVDEPMKVASWRRKKDEQQEVVAAQDEQESSSSSSPSSEDDEEEKEDEKDRGGWLPARARASRN